LVFHEQLSIFVRLSPGLTNHGFEVSGTLFLQSYKFSREFQRNAVSYFRNSRRY